MELTNEQAIELSLNAADFHSKLAGRKEWSQEDVDLANVVYGKLKPVQKMDETTEGGNA